MRQIITLVLVSIAFATYANNGVTGQIDRNEVRLTIDSKRLLDIQYQHQLRNQPNWQNFLLQNGTWYVHFNEANGKPHKAFGKPITVSGNTAVEKVQNFIEQNLSGFGIPSDELEFLTMTSNAHSEHVFFGQRHNGNKVLFARLSVKLTIDGKVIGFSTDVYDHLEVEAAVLSSSEIAVFAQQNLTGNIVDVEVDMEAMILPIPDIERKRTVFRPVFEVMVNTVDENKIPGQYLTYVDGITGDVLLRKNLVSHCEHGTGEDHELPASSVDVTADVSLTQPFDPLTSSLLPNLEVSQGGNTFYTDNDGNIQGLDNGNATFILQGLWSQVFTDGNTPQFTATLAEGSNTIDFGNDANSKEVSAYYHVNIIHDFMKLRFPSFTSMDNALPTNIDVSGTCNAFYDGSSINFLTAGDGCNSYALVADVVYHEYAHGINDKYYQSQASFWQNGGMGEGYADVWGMGITENPILGLGNSQTDPNGFIRRYDINPKIYPQDLVGQVHADGEIIAGAWWDLGQNFGDVQQMIDLYAATYAALITGPDGTEGQVYVDILIEALQIDDSPSNGGDNDITNGTPNDIDIVDAFDAHGITLLSNATLGHAAIEAHDNTDIEIEITVDTDYPWALNQALVAYRLNASDTWNTVSLTNTSGNDYSAVIPGQPNATVIAYYVALENANGTLANVEPVAAHAQDPNVPYYILVGYELNGIEDFDSFQTNGWEEGLPSDNNSTGTWIIDVPIGSFSDDGVMVQTDEDRTAGSGNIFCAFTQNAENENSALGANDVDDGHTTLVTPFFDLSDFSDPAISYWRYYTNSPPSGANPGADWWQVLVTDNGTDWVYVEDSKVSDPSWQRVAFRVTDYVDLTDKFQVKFIVSDSLRPGQNLDGGSLVEGAMDDFEIWEIVGGLQSGIDETEISDFSIYPNPTDGNINLSITVEANTKLQVEVLNVVGEKVVEQNIGYKSVGKHSINMDLGSIASGIYFLRIQTETGSTVRRLEMIR
ncbi:MAG: T9SS type A sorting domain-containing protein [Flavobacteriales bacterium]|nr:T9SS type A sorting domain-containing protein [Flavobacteriales bacterium]